jgi:hypothetical protein
MDAAAFDRQVGARAGVDDRTFVKAVVDDPTHFARFKEIMEHLKVLAKA